MHTKTSLTLIVLALAASSLACSLVTDGLSFNAVTGSGPVVSQERSVGDFNAVSVGNQGNLFIETGERVSLRIEAEENLLDYIETGVRGNDLFFETRRNTNLRSREPINYYLTVPSDLLVAVQLTSSGDLTSAALSADSFAIQVSSSGDVHLQGLHAERLSVQISSSGDVTIDSGAVDQQTISISSSGNYEAMGVESRTAEVHISSSGNASVTVSERLDGSLSSSGDLEYHGNPDVDVSESSSGRVRQR